MNKLSLALTVVLLFTCSTVIAQWTNAELEQITSGTDYDLLCKPCLALDDDGTLHVVYDRFEDGHNLFYMQKQVGGEWSAASPIGDHTQLQAFYSMDVYEPTGEVYVVFHENFIFKLGIYNGEQWDYFDLRIPDEYGVGSPAIDIDIEGRAHIAMLASNSITNHWHTGYGYWDGTDDFHFQALTDTYLPEGGSFALPDICVSNDGSVAMVYRNFYQYMYMRLEVAENSALGADDWVYEEMNIGSGSYTGGIVSDHNDNLHLLIQTDLEIPFPGHIWYNKKSEAGWGWVGAVMISGEFNARHPHFDVEPDGTVHVVCHETQGLYSTGNLIYITNQNGNWEQEYLITGDSYEPSIAIDHEGNGNIVYRKEVTWLIDNDVYYYGFVADPPPVPNMAVSMVPDSIPVIIPAGGGTFGCTIEIENTGTSSAVFDAWLEADIPGGLLYRPIVLKQLAELQPGESVIREIQQSVPANAPGGNYTYRLIAGNYPSDVYASDEFEFSKYSVDGSEHVESWSVAGWEETVEPSKDSELTVSDFDLLNAYPNPFNPTTDISYQLSSDVFVNLTIYDIEGREVAKLVDSWKPAGVHEINFNASKLSSGVYFAVLNAGNDILTQKLLLVK